MHLFIFYQAIFDVKYIILVYIPRLDISLFDVYYPLGSCNTLPGAHIRPIRSSIREQLWRNRLIIILLSLFLFFFIGTYNLGIPIWLYLPHAVANY